jgi:hypothetical protein
MIRTLFALLVVTASTVAVMAGAGTASANPPVAVAVKPDLVIAKATGGFVVTNVRFGFSTGAQPASDSFHVSVRHRIRVCEAGDCYEYWAPWQHNAVRGLAAGSSQFVPSPVPSGSIATEAYVDGWGEVQERDELNNMWSIYVLH